MTWDRLLTCLDTRFNAATAEAEPGGAGTARQANFGWRIIGRRPADVKTRIVKLGGMHGRRRSNHQFSRKLLMISAF